VGHVDPHHEPGEQNQREEARRQPQGRGAITRDGPESEAASDLGEGGRALLRKCDHQ
jgi:hypothetical protein